MYEFEQKIQTREKQNNCFHSSGAFHRISLFLGIYAFKCFSFSTFEIQRDCVILTFFCEISFFSHESRVT